MKPSSERRGLSVGGSVEGCTSSEEEEEDEDEDEEDDDDPAPKLGLAVPPPKHRQSKE